MKFTMRKGNATALHEQDIYTAIKDQDFFAQSYIAGLNAISKYVQQAKPYREISGSNLYRSPLNIVAFSGGRGTGKTSTLLAMSKMLQDTEQLKNIIIELKASDPYTSVDNLANHNFYLLDPIDPTMLEENQNILSVILSRIMFEAEKKWAAAPAPKPMQAKNNLLSRLNACLNGINSIKANSSSAIENLDQLQRIGDSAALKQNFYELVNQLNQFGKEDTASDNNTLVIMIDDTDCQISKAYEIMEDIRKYLTLPNVLILMATDTKQLRLVLIQHFLNEFAQNLSQHFVSKEEIKHMADQYMTKLLPNINKVYLPMADEVLVENFTRLQLKYISESVPSWENVLAPADSEVEAVPSNLLKEIDKYGNPILAQSQILNYIFQKTHLVFLAHSKYINHIIPGTLRELSILLNLLSDMKDVPEILYYKKSSVTSANVLTYKTSKELREQIIKQLDILEPNLDLFESYFMNEWIPSNLSYEMMGILRGIASRAPEERCAYAYSEFLKYYENRGFNPAKSVAFDYIKEKITFKNLDMLLKLLNNTVRTDGGNIGNFRSQQDFNNIFAVRVLFTIKNMKYACEIKRQTIAATEDEYSRLIFDYYQGRHSLPKQLYLNLSEKTQLPNNVNLHSSEIINHLNLTEDIFQCLEHAKAYDNMSQQEIYEKQEAALLISVNSDLMEFVSKELTLTTSIPDTYMNVVKNSLHTLQNKIASLNGYMLCDYSENVSASSECYLTEKANAYYIQVVKIEPHRLKIESIYEELEAHYDNYKILEKNMKLLTGAPLREALESLHGIRELHQYTKGCCTKYLNLITPGSNSYPEIQILFTTNTYDVFTQNYADIYKAYQKLIRALERILERLNPKFQSKFTK